MKPTFFLGLFLLLSPFLYAEDVKPTEATKGCIMKFCSLEGGGVVKPFVKVADDEYNDLDDDSSQIWGYDPGNINRDKNNKVIYERAKEKEFILAGKTGSREGQPCMFKCPLW